MISLVPIRDGLVPVDLQGVRRADVTVERRFNVSSHDYVERIVTVDGLTRDVGTVLTGNPVDCDACASKWSAS